MLNIDDIQIASLPSLPLAERASLPECAAVYFAISKTGDVLYIGGTVRLLDRWRAHHRLPDLDDTVSIAWLAVDDAETLSDMERGLINRFRPSLNWLRHSGPTEESTTVAFRIPEWAKRHYEELALKERRNLSQVLRLVLEDHAKGRCGKNGRKQISKAA